MEEGEPLRAPAGLGRRGRTRVDEGDAQLIVERRLALTVHVRKVRVILANLGLTSSETEFIIYKYKYKKMKNVKCKFFLDCME